ncbi:hypothetical protein LXL04_038656 [Taraxacum kok-saghyz]
MGSSPQFRFCVVPLQAVKLPTAVLGDGFNSSISGVLGNMRDLVDISPALTEAAGAIVDDSFTRCFKSNPPEPWNLNIYIYLFPLWCLGVVVRYGILFPGSFFVASWTGVVKYHGPRPCGRSKQVGIIQTGPELSALQFVLWVGLGPHNPNEPFSQLRFRIKISLPRTPFYFRQMLMGGGGSFSAGGPGKGMYSRLYLRVLNEYPDIHSFLAFNSIYNNTAIFGIQATTAILKSLSFQIKNKKLQIWSRMTFQLAVLILLACVEASITFTEFSLDPGQYRVKMKPDFTVDHLLGHKIRAKRSSSGSGGSSATSPAGNVPPGGATTKPAGIEPPVSIFETRKLSMDPEELRKSSEFATNSIDVAAKELITVATNGVNQVQLDRAKQSTKSAILMNLESRIVASQDIGRQILTYGERKPVEFFLKVVDEVSAKDSASISQKLLSSPLTLASHGDVINGKVTKSDNHLRLIYCKPQNMKLGETGIEFAERVRDIISVRAGLKKVPWDGYLKYSRPSPKHRERKVKTSAVCGPHLQSSAEEEVVQTSAVCSKKTVCFFNICRLED